MAKNTNTPGHKGNANFDSLRFYLTPVRMAIIKNTNNNECWSGCEKKRNPHTLLMGM
jgi:hypothetical protein